MSQFFADPVVVWLDPKRPDFGIKLVRNVPEALSALHHYGLGDALQSPEAALWHSAAGALVKADVEPTPTNLQEGYEALLRLVKRIAPVPSAVRIAVSPRSLREHVSAFFGSPRDIALRYQSK